jgi:hypothetical protein
LIERQTEALKKQEDRINSLNKSKATGETFERRQTGVGGFDAVEPVAGGDKFGDVKLGNKELLDLLAERDQTVKDLEALPPPPCLTLSWAPPAPTTKRPRLRI